MSKARLGRPTGPLVPPSLWTSWQVCLPDDKGQWTNYPVAEVLLAGAGDDPETALQKMKLFETLGWPAARASLFIDKADDKEPPIGILKCKPSCWRLYFHVFEQNHDDNTKDKRILYLIAVCKKANAQQAQNTVRARNLLTAALDGRIKISRWIFPSE
jgi:hypothetical protein